MITIQEVRDRLNKILNGTDPEAPERPAEIAQYGYMVAAEGFLFRETASLKGKKDMIPVFVSTLGGEINPVKGLGEADYSIPVSVYFPVRLKDDLSKLEQYFADCLVGTVSKWGNQNARSNMSLIQYGELQESADRRFGSWLESNYLLKKEITETWLSMSFTIYLLTANGLGEAYGYVLGDSYKCSIRISGEGVSLNENEPTFVESSDSVGTQPASQQILGTGKTVGVAATTQYANTLNLYVKDTPFYRSLCQLILQRKAQRLILTVTETIAFSTPITAQNDYYIANATLPYRKGDLMVITMALSDRSV